MVSQMWPIKPHENIRTFPIQRDNMKRKRFEFKNLEILETVCNGGFAPWNTWESAQRQGFPIFDTLDYC